MNYDEILEDAIEFRQRFALVNVCLKIVKQDKYLIAENTELLTIIGLGNEDLMLEAFSDCELNDYFDKEGIYFADVLLNYIESDETQPDYYIVEAMASIGNGTCSGCEGHYQFKKDCPICMTYGTGEIKQIFDTQE